MNLIGTIEIRDSMYARSFFLLKGGTGSVRLSTLRAVLLNGYSIELSF